MLGNPIGKEKILEDSKNNLLGKGMASQETSLRYLLPDKLRWLIGSNMIVDGRMSINCEVTRVTRNTQKHKYDC